MYEKMKYIVIADDNGTCEELLLFPHTIIHRDVFRGVRAPSIGLGRWKQPVAGGFVQFNQFGIPHCYGESESLKVKSRPDMDKALLMDQMSMKEANDEDAVVEYMMSYLVDSDQMIPETLTKLMKTISTYHWSKLDKVDLAEIAVTINRNAMFSSKTVAEGVEMLAKVIDGLPFSLESIVQRLHIRTLPVDPADMTDVWKEEQVKKLLVGWVPEDKVKKIYEMIDLILVAPEENETKRETKLDKLDALVEELELTPEQLKKHFNI